MGNASPRPPPHGRRAAPAARKTDEQRANEGGETGQDQAASPLLSHMGIEVPAPGHSPTPSPRLRSSGGKGSRSLASNPGGSQLESPKTRSHPLALKPLGLADDRDCGREAGLGSVANSSTPQLCAAGPQFAAKDTMTASEREGIADDGYASVAKASAVVDLSSTTPPLSRIQQDPAIEQKEAADHGEIKQTDNVLLCWEENDDSAAGVGESSITDAFDAPPQDVPKIKEEDDDPEEEGWPNIIYSSNGAGHRSVNAPSQITEEYSIGRSQSVHDELFCHQQGRNAPIIQNTNAFATPNIDPPTPAGAHGKVRAKSCQEDDGVSVADFVPDPALQSANFTRSLTALVTSGMLAPVPVLARRSAGPSSHNRVNSFERVSGKGGGPNVIFSLTSRAYTGRLPPGLGGHNRFGSLAPAPSFLASSLSNELYPTPSGVRDDRIELMLIGEEGFTRGTVSGMVTEGIDRRREDPSRRLRRSNRQLNVEDSDNGDIEMPQTNGHNAMAAFGSPVLQSQNSRLRRIGGKTLFQRIDKPAGGIASEAELLGRALDEGDWAEVSVIVNRLAPRLIGDPNDIASRGGTTGGASRSFDPDIPTAPLFHAGGGRTGLERLTFRQSSGISLLINVLRHPAFVGYDAISSNDASAIPTDLVSTKLAPTWNEVMAMLREMAYAMPDLVANGGVMNDRGRLMPYLFTMLAHDSLFDGSAALIEEILSLHSQVGGPSGNISAGTHGGDGTDDACSNGECGSKNNSTTSAAAASAAINSIFSPHPPPPPLTFCLTQVTGLYDLWASFNPRKLAHFCRILALLVFEAEDRQLMESPSVLKSIELLQLRRDRAARSGAVVAPDGSYGCAVDRNQSIILGDDLLLSRLLSLLNVMNYAPNMESGARAYHVMAHFPWIADTLLMLGLSEFEEWKEIDRLDRLARSAHFCARPSDLGSVGIMLESLADPLLNPHADNNVQDELGFNGLGIPLNAGVGLPNATHLSQIIHVINAAQISGVIVGQRRGAAQMEDIDEGEGYPSGDQSRAALYHLNPSVSVRTVEVETEIQESPVAGDNRVAVGVELPEEDVRRQEASRPTDSESNEYSSRPSSRRSRRINHYADAGNELQLNALLLAPYQVEVLFVLCTLLGGRRKIDAQNMLGNLGLVPILEDMFDRLGWAVTGTARGNASDDFSNNYSSHNSDGYATAASAIFGFGTNQDVENEDEEPGIHGPACKCGPGSALRIQFLRLLHNFCDRDCDNYHGRRLLLSPEERYYLFSQGGHPIHDDPDHLNVPSRKGLLSKIIVAYKTEQDDSPYKFWLASCTESYLRGSSPQEQWYAARSSGLLEHLLDDVLDDRLHCAGNLQTAFDLLGELSKGNAHSLRMLLEYIKTERRFQRLMSVATANLVDSNVFVRALLLSIERVTSAQQARLREEHKHQRPGHTTANDEDNYFLPWINDMGIESRSYLTHTWWDVPTSTLTVNTRDGGGDCADFKYLEKKNMLPVASNEIDCDNNRRADWYPPMSSIVHDEIFPIFGGDSSRCTSRTDINSFGWEFAPKSVGNNGDTGDNIALFDATFSPDSLERLAWFLATNEARLLRDLLQVVDLRSINHENICCLNTAIVVTIFAHRRKRLSNVIDELRKINNESEDDHNPKLLGRDYQLESPAPFISAFEALDITDRGLDSNTSFPNHTKLNPSHEGSSNVLRNFRELLWFWQNYYTHRGRDRLSLEFSSHVRFQEWNDVVMILCADDGSSTSLLPHPVRLPKSPFQRAPRTVDLRERR